jgi:uncharacterized protein (DUF302 family)/uncharacterized membrane protein YidH (DUF202 family)
MTSGPSDYLAAERTYLAWIRTGLALMGFGFVVARFGIYIQALGAEQGAARPQTFGLSVPLGTVLIALGVLTQAGSSWNYIRVVRALKEGGAALSHPSRLGLSVAAVLAVLGLAMVIALTFLNREKTPVSDNGIISVPSHHSVDQTVDTIQALLKAKGIKLFALVDHSGEAKAAGLTMRPTKLLIFGNPKAGTALMVASPSVAIDLPLKLLVSEDASGAVWISYSSPAFLQARHNLPKEFLPVLASVEALANRAGE